ncbi:MAG: TraB/VirB10 family protein [Sulfurimonadaceae bacterium]|jgi:conjugal transfer pilus assembly protein TraB|nr:TraB/VirB10 family protein [Sulfurimonadaceae bacterium]
MKEKFVGNKKKQLFLMATVVVGASVLMILGSSLLTGDAAKEKEKRLLEMPKVKYIDSDKVEGDSFKKVYGEELTSTKQQLTQTQKQVEALTKLIEKREKDEKAAAAAAPKSTGDVILSNLPVSIPPLMGSDNEDEYDSEDEHEPTPTVIETRVIHDIIATTRQPEPEVDLSGSSSDKKEEVEAKKKKKTISIPAGSFVRATLVNGLDAPAGSAAKDEPHPVVLRITHDANLPNKFKSDIRECRAIASGYGELSSERAIIRIENMSCITKDGKNYESDGKTVGFLTGEDGKIGLAGRVVTKQGAILARTMAAGFMEGLAKVYEDSAQVVNTSGIGTTSTVDPNQANKAGLYSGIGEGAKKLSEYYLKLNDQMFPVVEINVGRKGDILFNKRLVLTEQEDEE